MKIWESRMVSTAFKCIRYTFKWKIEVIAVKTQVKVIRIYKMKVEYKVDMFVGVRIAAGES